MLQTYKLDREQKEKDPLEGIVFITGSIEDSTSEKVIRKIIEYNKEEKYDFIQMIINSEGGYTTSGFAIIDIMRWSRIPIYTTGIGLIASMGLLIFMAGERGSRVLTPRTAILSHRYSAMVSGSHSRLLAFRKEEDLMHRRILDHYREFSLLKTVKEVEKNLLRETDTWLTPDEAVNYGLADLVQNDQRQLIKKGV